MPEASIDCSFPQPMLRGAAKPASASGRAPRLSERHRSASRLRSVLCQVVLFKLLLPCPARRKFRPGQHDSLLPDSASMASGPAPARLRPGARVNSSTCALSSTMCFSRSFSATFGFLKFLFAVFFAIPWRVRWSCSRRAISLPTPYNSPCTSLKASLALPLLQVQGFQGGLSGPSVRHMFFLQHWFHCLASSCPCPLWAVSISFPPLQGHQI